MFAFAGLRDEWRDELETCALITTTANEVVGLVHGRMPAMLPKEQYQAWLDPDATEAELLGLLAPLPGELMEGYSVGTAVNSPSVDGPVCVEPV